ncbi:MAG TPA: hypothetical protein VK428_10250 [Acidimicrobiales bacterium]|nr:hypothetical protein [Acidimicrobiales bacterium]
MPTPDPDEPFSLWPQEPEDVLRKLLGAEEGEVTEEISEPSEEDESDS